jgi:DNA-binding MarR family transcriptional regulator
MQMAQKALVKRSRQSFTRLARFFNQLMREQLGCGPVTVQQCYTLEALADGPLSMKDLAAEVAVHQSTLTRVVEKLEKQNLVQRTRKSDNQRSVEVRLTDAGKQTYLLLDAAGSQMISDLLNLIPKERRLVIVDAMEEVANLLNPNNEAFQKLLRECRCGITERIDNS